MTRIKQCSVHKGNQEGAAGKSQSSLHLQYVTWQILRLLLVFCLTFPKCLVFFNKPFVSVKSGLPLGVVSIVQSILHAQPKGKTVLHADVGFLPGLPQLPGVSEITMEVCLQELCKTQHEDHVNGMFF